MKLTVIVVAAWVLTVVTLAVGLCRSAALADEAMEAL